MTDNSSDLNLITNVIPRRTRRSTCKSEKCPQRKARCRFRTVPSNSPSENVRDGTGKNILDVHRIIGDDLVGAKEALCQEISLDGRLNRKYEKIFDEVVEAYLNAFSDNSKQNPKGKSLESSPAIESCSITDSSFRKPESISIGFSKVHSNIVDQIGNIMQTPTTTSIWKRKKTSAVVDGNPSEVQKLMTRNSSNSNDFEDIYEEILSKFEGALNWNSRGRKGRIPKKPKHQCLEKNQSNSQQVKNKYREVEVKCSNQQQNCPPCECILSNQGHISVSKNKYKFKPKNLAQREVKPRKLDQMRVGKSNFDEKFRCRRKGTDDDGVCPPIGWWKPVFEIGLVRNAMLCSDKYRINHEYQQKIKQKNKTFSNNNVFETDCLETYKPRDFPSKP